MHTDEYEISLLRELHVCEKKIKEITQVLTDMETKYKMTTEVVAAKLKSGNIAEGEEEAFAVWTEEYEALKKWEILRDQYAELLNRMKI